MKAVAIIGYGCWGPRLARNFLRSRGLGRLADFAGATDGGARPVSGGRPGSGAGRILESAQRSLEWKGSETRLKWK
jgi:hypothetical protein